MNNLLLSKKIKYYLFFPNRFGFVLFICLFLLSQTTYAQYRFDTFTTDNGLPQNGVRGIAQTPDGYLWFTTFDGLVRYDGAQFTVFDKNNSPGISNNRFADLHVEPDGSLFAGTEDGDLTVYRDGEFKTYTTADGLPGKTAFGFQQNMRGEFYISTNKGNSYFRDGKFIPVAESDVPNQRHFYTGHSGSVWMYDNDGITQITPDRREIFYPIKFELYNDYFSGLKLFEDSGENLWLGDLTGVYCLKDGNIKKFTAADGVPPRISLRPYLEDKDGSIWFASALSWLEGVGVVRYKDGKFTTWGKSAGLSSHFVANLFKDREGTIWVTSDGGLNHLQKQLIKPLSIRDGLVHSEVYPLLETRDGNIYIGTTRGLSRWHNGKFSTVLSKNEEGIDIYVTSLFEDRRGRVWVGALGGDLFVLENEQRKRIKISDKAVVSAIAEDREGNIWLAAGNGLLKYQNDRLVARYTSADGLPTDDVRHIHQDRSGAFWLGTYNGLSKFENEKFTTFTVKDGLASDRIRTIYETDDGTLWIGTYDGGLSRFKDGKFFTYNIGNGLFNNGVFQILEDRRGNFWISCNKGIYRVSRAELDDFADGKIAKINSVAYDKQDGMLNTECNGGRQPAGIKTNDGKLWFPTQDGVVVLNPDEVGFNPNPPPVQIESVLIERQPIDLKNGVELNANEDNVEIRYTGISFIKPEQIKFRYRIEGLDENWVDVGTIRDVYFPSLPAGAYDFHVIAANSDGVWNTTGARLKIRVNAPFWRKNWFIALASLTAVVIIFLIFRLRERELKRRQFIQQEFARRLIESQEQERKRIASELHDSLGQYLLAIKNWALFGLNSVTKENPAREYLTEVSETTSLALEEVREMTHNLRPYQLERLGLTNTLEYMLKNIRNSSPIQFSCEIENVDGLLSKEAEIVFYRVVQETINNVIKHSEANNAQISIKPIGNILEFVCRDDGRGFDIDAAKKSGQSGLGLEGIAERLKILGGQYEIASEIGKGTIVSVKVNNNK